MVPDELDDAGIPDWREMPKPIAVITMSWEDIYVHMCETLDRKPSRDEVEKLFACVPRRTGDALMEAYWQVISDLITIEVENEHKTS